MDASSKESHQPGVGPVIGALAPWKMAATLGVFVSLLVFGSSLFGGFAWDDQRLIVDNERLASAAWSELLSSPFWEVTRDSDPMQENGAYKTVYRPVVTAYLATVRRSAGLNALAYRFCSLVLHLLVVVMAARWLHLRERHASARWLTLAVLFFAVHPTKTESVAWVSGVSDLWLGVFVLGALLAREHARGEVRYVLFAIFFSLALLSKETAIGLALFVLADELVSDTSRTALKSTLLSLLSPLALVTALRMFALDAPLLRTDRMPTTFGDLERIAATAGHYVLHTWLPFEPTVHPSFLHQDSEGVPLYAPPALAAGGVLFLLVAGMLTVFATRSDLREVLRNYLLALLLWVGFLLPVLGFIKLGGLSLTADRFLYIPTLGAALGLLGFSARQPPHWVWQRWLTFGVATALITVGALRAAQHVPNFYSSRAVWAQSVRVNARNWQALRFLAAHLAREGKLSQAQALSQRAYTICESESRPLEATYLALQTLGLLVERTSVTDRASRLRFAKALTRVPKATRLTLRHPALKLDVKLDAQRKAFVLSRPSEYHRVLAQLLSSVGEHGKAAEQLLFAASHFSHAQTLWSDRAVMLARAGAWQEARVALRQAHAQASPVSQSAEAAISHAYGLNVAFDAEMDATKRLELGVSTQLVLGDVAGALRALKAPDQTSSVLESLRVQALIADRRWEEARQHLDEATRLYPNDQRTWQRLGDALDKARAGEKSIIWDAVR